MIVRLARTSIFALAALALSGSVALSQAAPATPAPAQPAAPSATATAPVERRPPYGQFHRGPGQEGGRPGMMQGQRNGNFNRTHNFQKRGNFRGGPGGNFRGPQGGGFHGPQGGGMGMAAGLHMGPAGMWWKNPMVVQRLTLTADQTRRMDDIFQKSRLELIDLRAKLETQNAILEPILSGTPFDSAKALAQVDKVAEARADLEKADARMLIGIRGVLTPDQWTKLHDHQGPSGFGAQGGPGAPDGQGGPPAGGGRGRGQRGGGPPPNASNLVDPIDLP